MLLVPLVVIGKLDACSNLLMALDLELVEVCEMALGANVGKKMGDVREVRLLRADAADEHCRIHDADAVGPTETKNKVRKQQMKHQRRLLKTSSNK